MNYSDIFATYNVVKPPKIDEDILTDDTMLDFYGDDIEIDYPTPIFADDTPEFVDEDIPKSSDPTITSLTNNILNTGRSLLGNKYISGGNSPDKGFDCSGYLQYVFKENGIDLPKSTEGIFKSGTEVSLNNLQVGDIICSKGSGASGRHVSMVSRIGSDGSIYVLEAKGKDYGVVEDKFTKPISSIITIRRVINQGGSISNTVQAPQKYKTKESFSNSLIAAYKQELMKKGLNPDYAYALTAQDALESGWGKHATGKYNYGGINAGKDAPGTYKYTTQWDPNKGMYKTKTKFRNFSSLNDYCKYKINLVSNSRYNIFNRVAANKPYDFAMTLLVSGYGSDRGGPHSRKYASDVTKIYNSIRK